MARAKISHAPIQILYSPVASAQISQHVVEVLVSGLAVSGVTPEGAIVSQHVVEVLVSPVPSVRVGQHVVEVLVSESAAPTVTGGGETAHTFVG